MAPARLHVLIATTLLSAGLAPAAGSASVSAREPRAPASEDAIVAYRSSGAWDRDLALLTDQARERLQATIVPRPMLVLDIDDTSLSTYDCLARTGFRRSRDSGCARSGRLPAIPQTLSLYRYARERGIAVTFITGRRQALRRVTLANLASAGFEGALRVRLRPDHERPGRHAGFKARHRRALERRGFRIVANVGDQRSDLAGGAADSSFKLPNPMYTIRTA